MPPQRQANNSIRLLPGTGMTGISISQSQLPSFKIFLQKLWSIDYPQTLLRLSSIATFEQRIFPNQFLAKTYPMSKTLKVLRLCLTVAILGFTQMNLSAQWNMAAEDTDVQVYYQNVDCNGHNVVLFQLISKSQNVQDVKFDINYQKSGVDKQERKFMNGLQARSSAAYSCKDAGGSNALAMYLPKGHAFDPFELNVQIIR